MMRVEFGMAGTRTRTPLSAADFRTTSTFAAAPKCVRGPDCALAVRTLRSVRLRPSSLYTFPLSRTWLGVVTSRDREFAEFERIPQAVSPLAAQQLG